MLIRSALRVALGKPSGQLGQRFVGVIRPLSELRGPVLYGEGLDVKALMTMTSPCSAVGSC